jgi:hypothetical protein
MHTLPSRAFAPAGEVCLDRLACETAFANSLGEAAARDFPYPHWLLAGALPLDLAWALAGLPIGPPPSSLLSDGCPTGCDTRPITWRETQAFPDCRVLAETFQCSATVALFARVAGIDLRDCRLKITLARAVDGYESAPRTRCGEARFTLMIALDADGQRNLGPDIYFESGDWASQAPWRAGDALAFAPSERSWHGFEARMIRGVRTSLVVDYVPLLEAVGTDLPFPRSPAGCGV